MSHFPSPRFALACALSLAVSVSDDARAGAFFQQFGTTAPILAPGQGVEFVLAGDQRPAQVIAELSFHLRLFFNEGGSLVPELTFSPGDVLRFRMGDTVVIYQYDDPTNILVPPFQTFSFYNATGIDDNFGPTDPIGLALTQSDTNGTTFALEVLAGDGVRFSGLEFADTIAGTFQMGGQSTLTRIYDIRAAETVLVDFEALDIGTPVSNQFESVGVTFFGDPIFDEQRVIDVLGAGLDLLDGRMLINQSTTPPLGRQGFMGMRYDRPVGEVRFDFAGPASSRVALFDGNFEAAALESVETITATPGASGLPEGTAILSLPTGFDGIILAEKKGILVDDVYVSFLPQALVNFEGLHEGSVLEGQFSAMGVTFFGDDVVSEESVAGGPGAGYDLLQGNLLRNTSSTPPLLTPGYVGLRFDSPVSAVRFNFAGPTILVQTYLGGFTAANLIAVQEFVPGTGSTGFSEGSVVIENPAGFDGLIIAESNESVLIDDLSVTFLP